jgi:hypothetical protein
MSTLLRDEVIFKKKYVKYNAHCRHPPPLQKKKKDN